MGESEQTNPGQLRSIPVGKRRPLTATRLLRIARDVVKTLAPFVAAAWAAFSWVQGRFDRLEARQDRQFEFLLNEIRALRPAPPPPLTRQEP